MAGDLVVRTMTTISAEEILFRLKCLPFCQELGSKMSPRTCSASGPYHRAKCYQAVSGKEKRKKEKKANTFRGKGIKKQASVDNSNI